MKSTYALGEVWIPGVDPVLTYGPAPSPAELAWSHQQEQAANSTSTALSSAVVFGALALALYWLNPGRVFR